MLVAFGTLETRKENFLCFACGHWSLVIMLCIILDVVLSLFVWVVASDCQRGRSNSWHFVWLSCRSTDFIVQMPIIGLVSSWRVAVCELLSSSLRSAATIPPRSNYPKWLLAVVMAAVPAEWPPAATDNIEEYRKLSSPAEQSYHHYHDDMMMMIIPPRISVPSGT